MTKRQIFGSVKGYILKLLKRTTNGTKMLYFLRTILLFRKTAD